MTLELWRRSGQRKAVQVETDCMTELEHSIFALLCTYKKQASAITVHRGSERNTYKIVETKSGAKQTSSSTQAVLDIQPESVNSNVPLMYFSYSYPYKSYRPVVLVDTPIGAGL